MNNSVSIMEDDAPARQILAGWIARAKGLRCLSEHGSGEDALPHVPSANPAMVLVDIDLPGMSGIECVRQSKLRLTATQFVKLTVHEEPNHVFDAMSARTSGYLVNCMARKRPLAELTGVHEGGSPMTSNLARKVVQSFQAPKAGSAESLDLSQREREVLDLLARGYAFEEISSNLSLSVTTVSSYVRRTCVKLHVCSQAQAVATYTHLVRSGVAWHKPARH